ncbi:TPA: hypothetical protein EYP66_25630 [Candidatus Poribacteria bacterium]|nr:hypothetical protein [Candidatus Poribacteria bacterium]
MEGNYIGYFNHNREFASFKNEHPFLKVVHSQVLKETLRRLHKAYQKLFDDKKNGRKTGRPKWNNRIQITFGKNAEGKQLRIIVGLNEPLKSNSFGQVVRIALLCLIC